MSATIAVARSPRPGVLRKTSGGIGGGAPDVKDGEAGGPLCAGGAAAGEAAALLAKRANAPKALAAAA